MLVVVLVVVVVVPLVLPPFCVVAVVLELEVLVDGWVVVPPDVVPLEAVVLEVVTGPKGARGVLPAGNWSTMPLVGPSVTVETDWPEGVTYVPPSGNVCDELGLGFTTATPCV